MPVQLKDAKGVNPANIPRLSTGSVERVTSFKLLGLISKQTFLGLSVSIQLPPKQ